MALLKKTLVLTNEKPVGFITFIRVGNTAGGKVTMNAPFAGKRFLSVRLGEAQQTFHVLESEKTEVSFPVFTMNDTLGAILTDESGNVIATGGVKESVRLPDLQAAIAVYLAPSAPEKTAAAEPEPRSEQKKDADENPFGIAKDANFYQGVRSRLEELLTIHPKEAHLERLIPESSWVRVAYDGEDYYVVGLLREGKTPTHIAYGVPGTPAIRPPQEAESFCDFLTVKELLPAAEGYWLLFQSVEDGGMVKN